MRGVDYFRTTRILRMRYTIKSLMEHDIPMAILGDEEWRKMKKQLPKE